MKTSNISAQTDGFITSLGFRKSTSSAPLPEYFHRGICIHLVYMDDPASQLADFDMYCVDKVVVVPDQITLRELAHHLRCEFEVIRLADLPRFVAYRAFNSDCSDHLKAKRRVLALENALGDAEENAEEANVTYENAAEALFAEVHLLHAMPYPLRITHTARR
jgi:hypothetical protein